MQASNFDFDVITGPSTPREKEQDDARAPEPSPTRAGRDQAGDAANAVTCDVVSPTGPPHLVAAILA